MDSDRLTAIKEALSLAPGFFTNWNWILWIVSLFTQVPLTVQIAIESSLLTCAILGCYFINHNIENWVSKYATLTKRIMGFPMTKSMLRLMDFLAHVVPFVCILAHKFIRGAQFITRPERAFVEANTFNTLFGMCYLLFQDPSEVYSPTNLSIKSFVVLSTVSVLTLNFLFTYVF